MSPADHALMIAERLLDPARVVAAASSRPAASLQSLAGTALLHARLACVDRRFEAAAGAHWSMTDHVPTQQPGWPGVFAAPGGMAASLIVGTPYLTDPEPYRPAVLQAVRWLTAAADDKTAQVGERLRSGAPLTWTDYDAITGVAGIGRVLLAAVTGGHQDAEPALLACLRVLTAVIGRPGARPRWWMPAAGHPATGDVPPSGRADTGMAHGVAGPLALLAHAAAAGWVVDWQTSAIETASVWLWAWQDSHAQRWPPYVSGDDLDHHAARPAFGRGDAWCYGTPGIARALTAAARVSRASTEAVVSALSALAERPARQWDVKGPALCHGYAGVLQCAAGHLGLSAVAAAGVTGALDEAAAFGVGQVDDDPGLLTGAAGVALALADHAGLPTTGPRTRWDALLML